MSQEITLQQIINEIAEEQRRAREEREREERERRIQEEKARAG